LRVYYPTYWTAIDHENMDLIRRLVNSWCKFINVKKRLNKQNDYCTIIEYARKKKFEGAINLLEKLEVQMNFSFSVFARNLSKIEKILMDNNSSILINYNFKNMIDSNATLKYYILRENNIDLVNCIKKYSQKFSNELMRLNDYMLDESRSHDIPVLFSLLKSNISLDLLKIINNRNDETSSFKSDHSELRYKGETLLFYSVDINLKSQILSYLLDFKNCQNEVFTNRNSLNMTIFEYLSLLNNGDQYTKLFNKILVDYFENSERLRVQLAYNGFDFDMFISNNSDLLKDISTELSKFIEKVRDYQDYIKIFHEAVEFNDYHKVCKYSKYESDCFKNNLINSRVASNNQSVFHRATLNQNIHILEFLLENRDPSIKLDLIRDHCFRTPLHYAHGMIDNKKITSLLLEYGFSENVFDKDGMSPLDFNERQESDELKELIILHKNKKLDVIEPNPWSFNVWTRLQQEKDCSKQITLFNTKIMNHHGHSHGHGHSHHHPFVNNEEFNGSCIIV
jgi:ankyrin repeat protein